MNSSKAGDSVYIESCTAYKYYVEIIRLIKSNSGG